MTIIELNKLSKFGSSVRESIYQGCCGSALDNNYIWCSPLKEITRNQDLLLGIKDVHIREVLLHAWHVCFHPEFGIILNQDIYLHFSYFHEDFKNSGHGDTD